MVESGVLAASGGNGVDVVRVGVVPLDEGLVRAGLELQGGGGVALQRNDVSQLENKNYCSKAVIQIVLGKFTLLTTNRFIK